LDGQKTNESSLQDCCITSDVINSQIICCIQDSQSAVSEVRISVRLNNTGDKLF